MSKPSNETINIRYKKEVQLRKSMEEAVKTVDARIAQAIAQTEKRIKEHYEGKIKELAMAAEAAVEEADKETTFERGHKVKAESSIKTLKDRIDELMGRLGSLSEDLERTEEDRQKWKKAAEEAAPTIQLLNLKVTNLTTLNDKVRSRMRRKEQEEETAILNRQVLSGSTPGLRRV